MKIQDGGCAYPQTMAADEGELHISKDYDMCRGMSLRDYFAGQAVAAAAVDDWDPGNFHLLAKHAYGIADALIAHKIATEGGAE